MKTADRAQGRTVPAGPGKTVPAGPGIGQWRTYEVTEGLAGAEVTRSFQDREGHLWFGTDGGLSRYDGEDFTTFTPQDGLAGSEVWSILEDREGQLWIGTINGGLSRYHGAGFTAFPPQGVWTAFQARRCGGCRGNWPRWPAPRWGC